MTKITAIIDKIILIVIFIVSITMVFSIFLKVVFRYVFSSPLFWTEELARYCFIYIVFFGGAWAGKNLSHLGVDYFVNKLPLQGKNAINCLVDLLIIIFSISISIIAIPVVRVNMNQLSPALHIPMGLVYIAIPIGFVLCAFYYFSHLLDDLGKLRGKKAC